MASKVFNPNEILKQIDIHGSTLNYKDPSVFYDVEAAAYKGKLQWIRDGLIPTPPFLQKGSRILEREGDTLSSLQNDKH